MILDELKWRGLITQCTDDKELAEYLSKPQSLYVGFDPRRQVYMWAVFLPLMMLRRFQSFGHKTHRIGGRRNRHDWRPEWQKRRTQLQSKEALRPMCVVSVIRWKRFWISPASRCHHREQSGLDRPVELSRIPARCWKETFRLGNASRRIQSRVALTRRGGH